MDMGQVTVDVLMPALSNRVVIVNRQERSDQVALVLLQTGSVRRQELDEDEEIVAPALWIYSTGRGARLALVAGSRAFVLKIPSSLAVDIFPTDPEGLACRACLEKSMQLSLSTQAAENLSRRCQELSQELGREMGGSWLMISALLQLIVVTIWREVGGDLNGIQQTGVVALLQRFRNLVEQEFRHQRPVSFYAGQLGVSPDRLHAICTRELRRSPLALIHERLFQEARIRLERSNASVQSISATLNFKDPAHFSRFFKNSCGQSPSAFRDAARAADRMQSAAASLEYHDWP